MSPSPRDGEIGFLGICRYLCDETGAVLRKHGYKLKKQACEVRQCNVSHHCLLGPCADVFFCQF